MEAGSSLKDGVRSSSGRSRLRSAFVVGQIACSVLLVVLGASFVRVLRHAGAADPGFDSRGVDIATLDSSVTGEPKAGPAAFWRTVIDRVRQMPAVESASLARVPPGGFEGIGLGGVAPGDQPGTTDDVLSGLEHRRHPLLRDAPHSDRRRARLRADRHGWGSAGRHRQRDARATLLAWTAGDRKTSEARGLQRPRPRVQSRVYRPSLALPAISDRAA